MFVEMEADWVGVSSADVNPCIEEIINRTTIRVVSIEVSFGTLFLIVDLVIFCIKYSSLRYCTTVSNRGLNIKGYFNLGIIALTKILPKKKVPI